MLCYKVSTQIESSMILVHIPRFDVYSAILSWISKFTTIDNRALYTYFLIYAEFRICILRKQA